MVYGRVAKRMILSVLLFERGFCEKIKKSVISFTKYFILSNVNSLLITSANNISSPEVVLFHMNGDSATFERNNFPIRFTEGTRSTPATATFPSQNLVDAFQTVNGYPVTLTDNGWKCEDPAFNPQNPYANRDPRFGRTILANGMTFKGSEIAVYKGGSDYTSVSEGGSPTGYFLRKYIQETTSFEADKEVVNKHHWIVYRYAETLLTYAESMVMAFKNPQYTNSDFPKSAEWTLNEVRINAGMPTVSITDPNEFMKALQNEWRVEFAFEDHRFWDIRRWQIGEDTQKELYGDRVNPQRAANFGASKAEEGILAYLFRNPDHLGRILSEVDEDAFVTDFNRQLFRIMKEKLQTNNGVSLSDFAEELSPEQMARLTAIVNQETPNSETALSDYVRALSEYKMRDESRHAGELSVEELQNVAERIRQQKKK
mgnify:CR=1 FL=1